MGESSSMSDETQEETLDEETTSEKTEELDLETDANEAEEKQDEAEGEADAETLKAEVAKLKEQNAKLYARVKKEQKKPEVVKDNHSNSGITREEAILYAKGHTDEEVNLALKIAKVSGITPLKAAEDAFFKNKVEERLKKEQSERASLGASKGSQKFMPKDVGKMSTEEHKKLFDKLMGNA